MTSTDFDKIAKAITNTYELIRLDEQPSETALEMLKEAEISLNEAKSYVLTKLQSIS
ncbi:hypothetical protein MXL46_01255 [Heyndrickxia sporothermodurans]|uniref:Uncharacterized protein n=1 Tax=Heyndrickxia sporothermodurans TaxID=46224 RepID=A0A150LAH9_9BACI|nr:hypothetical protein [Heyndrickxia sporothermodurans]KYD09220.1 hypothetical protein B4102_2486 [Heyndrickxia sporothermodurans]MBL5767035.1 hypothetical protein [Heyndrickxia sporothermodurans]MBL5770520.1 hypothetical protein [Heyndrickxia sporothermodurans]MBL5774209.1 hypothetical protein [Heyndrickxia sporothermodurans]MBL5778057.1 hypothetical protein [Heyndrickxia sporothermodurans]